MPISQSEETQERQNTEVRRFFAMGNMRYPGIIGCIERDKSRIGQWATDVDFTTILADLITPIKKITSPGNYLLSPCAKTPLEIGQVVECVIKHLNQLENPVSGLTINVPITTGVNWSLLSICIKDGKIYKIEHSDAIGGVRAVKFFYFKNKKYEYKSLIDLPDDYFSNSFEISYINRNEQRRNCWSSMDYTLQHALRKLGKTLYNKEDGLDYFSLDYHSGTNERAKHLRESLENIIIDKLLGCEQVGVRKLTEHEKIRLENQWLDMLDGEKDKKLLLVQQKKQVKWQELKQNLVFIMLYPFAVILAPWVFLSFKVKPCLLYFKGALLEVTASSKRCLSAALHSLMSFRRSPVIKVKSIEETAKDSRVFIINNLSARDLKSHHYEPASSASIAKLAKPITRADSIPVSRRVP